MKDNFYRVFQKNHFTFSLLYIIIIPSIVIITQKVVFFMANIEKSNKKEKVVYRDGLGKIKNPSKSLFGKIMIWVLAVLIGFAGFYFALQMKFPFLILISAAIIYSAYKVNSMLNIEFEYIATNGSVDVDKIINKSFSVQYTF